MNQKKEKKRRRKVCVLFSSRSILTRIEKAQVQDNGHIDDKDPPSRQNRQSCEQILKRLQLGSGNDFPSQVVQWLQNKCQKNYYIYDTMVVFKKTTKKSSKRHIKR